MNLRRIVLIVALLNLAYFGIEFAVLALGWSARSRARVGMALALILLMPGLATLWTAWEKFNVPVPPQPIALTLAGLGALAVNLSCAYMLAAHRHRGGSLTKAAFLSARNDALANIAIIAAGLVTALLWHSAWPDLAVGLGIAVMNAGAAREVWEAAREEHRAAA
ncbi:cation transporter [Mesorhizobium sp. M0761]|uniref:cation transporter n=1 Tax=Mesorhizobium sp. M0761 TaxID=2956994 RepID=UPI003338E67D